MAKPERVEGRSLFDGSTIAVVTCNKCMGPLFKIAFLDGKEKPFIQCADCGTTSELERNAMPDADEIESRCPYCQHGITDNDILRVSATSELLCPNCHKSLNPQQGGPL